MSDDIQLTRDDLLRLTDESVLRESGQPIHAEVIEAKLRYLDRVMEADGDIEAGNAFTTYQNDLFEIVHGIFTMPRGEREFIGKYDMRNLNLGTKFDDALHKVRADYLVQCARARDRAQTSKAFHDYQKKVLRIVDDAIDAAARAARPVKAAVADRAAPPAPEPAPAPSPPPVSRIAKVEVVDTLNVPDDTANLAAELERALTPNKVQPDKISAAAPSPAPANDIYALADKKLSERWKEQPNVPKRRKRGSSVGDVL